MSRDRQWPKRMAQSTGSSKGALPPHGAVSRQTGVRCCLLHQVLGQAHPLHCRSAGLKAHSHTRHTHPGLVTGHGEAAGDKQPEPDSSSLHGWPVVPNSIRNLESLWKRPSHAWFSGCSYTARPPVNKTWKCHFIVSE